MIGEFISSFVPRFIGSTVGTAVAGPVGGIIGSTIIGREMESPRAQPVEVSTTETIQQSIAEEVPRILGGFLQPYRVGQPERPIIEQTTKLQTEAELENTPSSYQAGAALVPQVIQQFGRSLFGGAGGLGGVAGGLIGGALTQYGVEQMMGNGACGCEAKAFVRLDKCGRPIITRAMQAKAKDMVMCMGIEQAAAALGITVPLLAEIAFKKFKPRTRGISGAQLKTARRVNNQVMHMAKKLQDSCKTTTRRR